MPAGSLLSLRTRLAPLLALSLSLGLSLVACGGGGDDDPPDGSGDEEAPPDDGATDGADDPEPEPGPGFEQPPLIEGLATLAGTSISGTADGDREHALFNNPVNVIIADDGRILVADFDNSLIRAITPEGDVTTLNRPPVQGMFVRPFGMALAGDTLYVQTDGNSLGEAGPPGGALWRMSVGGSAPELVLDNVGRPRGMVEVPDGRIVMSDFQQHVIQIYDPVSDSLAVLAGGLNAPGYRDGVGTEASFNAPYDIVALADGTLLVADHENHRLRIVDLAGNVTTYAGTGTAGSQDGAKEAATFNRPQGLATDEAGNIYVTDIGNFIVRRIAPDGQVTAVAGNASPGYLDSETPLDGQLFGIEGIATADDYLYITDGNRGEVAPYHRIRRLTIPAP